MEGRVKRSIGALGMLGLVGVIGDCGVIRSLARVSSSASPWIYRRGPHLQLCVLCGHILVIHTLPLWPGGRHMGHS